VRSGDGSPDRGAVLSRRRLLYLSAAAVASGVGAAVQPRALSTMSGAGVGGTSTRGAVHPVPVRARPAFRLPEVLPAAGATAVALTVDDGPDPHWTPQVLALFARLRVQATFSLIGRQARRIPTWPGESSRKGTRSVTTP
jgi:hypothetical protein